MLFSNSTVGGTSVSSSGGGGVDFSVWIQTLSAHAGGSDGIGSSSSSVSVGDTTIDAVLYSSQPSLLQDLGALWNAALASAAAPCSTL